MTLGLAGSLDVIRILAPPVTTPVATTGALTFAGSLSVTAIPFSPPVTSTVSPAGSLTLSGALTVTALEPQVPEYVGEVVRMVVEVFDGADVWLDARDADTANWDGAFTGDNTIDSDLLVGRIRWRNSGGQMNVNRTTASTGSLSDARSGGGTLSGLYMHVSHSGTTEVFTSDEITNQTNAGNAFIALLFTTAVPAATTGDTATIVFATNTLAGAMPVTSTVTPAGALTFAGSLSVVKTTAAAGHFDSHTGRDSRSSRIVGRHRLDTRYRYWCPRLCG